MSNYPYLDQYNEWLKSPHRIIDTDVMAIGYRPADILGYIEELLDTDMVLTLSPDECLFLDFCVRQYWQETLADVKNAFTDVITMSREDMAYELVTGYLKERADYELDSDIVAREAAWDAQQERTT